jgi:DNA-binding CsgD family transcriptional regulator
MEMQRAWERITRLSGQGLDLVTFWREASLALTSAVPHYMSPCWYTMDPASLLVTSHYHPEILELPVEWLIHEYGEDDFHKMADVARSHSGVSTLHDATGGDPSRSPGWRLYVEPNGGDQEMHVALRTKAGETWAMLGLYREPGKPLFDAREQRFLVELSPYLAEGAQRALLVGEASDPEGSEAPGLVVLRDDWNVDSLTPGVEKWLDEISEGEWGGLGRLPPSLLAVAGRALRASRNANDLGEVAVARVLAATGRWFVLHGTPLVASGSRRVAVIIEPAHSARISSLLMAAYGLTMREQEVCRLVLQGNSTSEIAERLVVSPHTVQQHLKGIFDKTGVRSRRELVGKVFFSHYEPRLRDNERRTILNQPLRGGPLPGKIEP